MPEMGYLDAGVRLERRRDGFEGGVELSDARLGQQVHEVQAGEYGLVLGFGNDEFVVKVDCFCLRNVPLKRIHISNF